MWDFKQSEKLLRDEQERLARQERDQRQRLNQTRSRLDQVTSELDALYDPSDYQATPQRMLAAAARARGEAPTPVTTPEQSQPQRRPTLAEWEIAVKKSKGEIV
jgi:hypothetical protein